MNFTLSELETAMNNEIKLFGGIDEAVAACDRMYSATFRSNAIKLSSLDDWKDKVHSLYLEAASILYAKATGQQAPEYEDVSCGCYHDCDCNSDSFMYACESFENMAETWLQKKHPEFVVDGNSLVVDFCNYKGEGDDGLGLYVLHKHLPVFKSKSHSFNQVN
jgi:hypothetical protein